jgi:hypothetical protein
MLPIHSQLARRATESHVGSALPDAPIVERDEAAPAAATRRAVASRLVALADRVSPEPVERSRWQSG